MPMLGDVENDLKKNPELYWANGNETHLTIPNVDLYKMWNMFWGQEMITVIAALLTKESFCDKHQNTTMNTHLMAYITGQTL